MNLNHPQLSPTVNRTRRIPGSPASPAYTRHNIPQPSADPQNPYQNTHLGLFHGSVRDEAGNDRPYAFYIPTTMKTSGNMVIVLIPGGEDPSSFFHRNSWKESLERHAVTAYFVSAPDGWRLNDPGFEIDVATRILSEMRSMEYFPCNAPGVYCLGFGDGANIAAVFSILHTSVLAAWGAWGDTQLDPTLLELIGNAPSDCDDNIPKSAVPLPTFVVGSESNVTRFFRQACRARDEYLHNGFARVYRQTPKPGASLINDPACTEVWVSSDDAAAKLGRDVMIEKLVAFVEDYKRWGGEGNSYVRKTERPESDLGMIRTEAVIDGLKRYWYTFEPSAYKRSLKERYPLVIAVHGFSCSGEFFAENSGWHKVGEERGAIIVYPTAYPFDRSPGNGRFQGIAATPCWNSGGMGSDSPDPQGPDDVSFFRQLLDYVQKSYPIDPERIYITGHSNGSLMTQRVMRFIPEKFAGFAPVGAMECSRGRTPAPTDGIRRNVWYTIGEFDGMGCKLEDGNGNMLTLEMICEANGIDLSKRRYYETGIYQNTIIRDPAGVPLVRFTGVKNWPHTYSPELAFMIYDEFFSRFVRHKDGTLEYLA